MSHVGRFSESKMMWKGKQGFDFQRTLPKNLTSYAGIRMSSSFH